MSGISQQKLSFSEIKELMDKLAATGLGGLTLRDGDFELRIDAKQSGYATVCESMPAAEVPAPPPCAPEAAQGQVVKSPIVGTFYASPAADKPPYVRVGSQVKRGDVLFLIESMKLMNEIQCEFDGEVTEILVENAQGLEYGQPVMILK